MVEHSSQLYDLDMKDKKVGPQLDAHFKKLHPELGKDLVVGGPRAADSEAKSIPLNQTNPRASSMRPSSIPEVLLPVMNPWLFAIKPDFRNWKP